MRKVLAADGVASAVASEVVTVVAAAAEGRLMVKVRRTEAETTSKVTAVDGTPASVATLFVSSVRTVGVKSETDPETTTVVDSVAAVGGSGTGGGDDGGGGGGFGGSGGVAGGGGLGGGESIKHVPSSSVALESKLTAVCDMQPGTSYSHLASSIALAAYMPTATAASALIVASFAKFRAVGSVHPTIGYVQEVVSVAVES